jgi:hypothetical protein
MNKNVETTIEWIKEDGFRKVGYKGKRGDKEYFYGVDNETNEFVELEFAPTEEKTFINIRAPFHENKWYELTTIENH